MRNSREHPAVFFRAPGIFSLILLPSLVWGQTGAVAGISMPSQQVKVNRALPKVQPTPAFPVFSAEPSVSEIQRARVFGEPLVPVGSVTTPAENRALADALTSYLRQGDAEDAGPLLAFLASYPGSAWRASLLANVGTIYRGTARYSKALVIWEQAWRLLRDESDPPGHTVGDRVVGELAALEAGLGRAGRLRSLLHEIRKRDIRGPATEKIAGAKQGLWLMLNRPEEAFRCGSLALERIVAHQRQLQHRDGEPLDLRATRGFVVGATLLRLKTVAAALGLSMQMAKRVRGSAVQVPAVVHWEAGPFAAVLSESNGRFLVHDPSLNEDVWVSRQSLDDEASGYFLVLDGPLPPGWRTVEPHEGEQVWYPMPFAFSEGEGWRGSAAP